MGWKHEPARWWKDAQAERDAYDAAQPEDLRTPRFYGIIAIDACEIEVSVRYWYTLTKPVAYGVIDAV